MFELWFQLKTILLLVLKTIGPCVPADILETDPSSTLRAAHLLLAMVYHGTGVQRPAELCLVNVQVDGPHHVSTLVTRLVWKVVPPHVGTAHGIGNPLGHTRLVAETTPTPQFEFLAPFPSCWLELAQLVLAYFSSCWLELAQLVLAYFSSCWLESTQLNYLPTGWKVSFILHLHLTIPSFGEFSFEFLGRDINPTGTHSA